MILNNGFRLISLRPHGFLSSHLWSFACKNLLPYLIFFYYWLYFDWWYCYTYDWLVILLLGLLGWLFWRLLLSLTSLIYISNINNYIILSLTNKRISFKHKNQVFIIQDLGWTPFWISRIILKISWDKRIGHNILNIF